MTIKISYHLLYISLIFFNLEAVPMPWYHGYFRQGAGQSYQRNCILINCAQKIRETALTIYHRVQRKKMGVNQALTTIHKRLDQFKIWALELEQEALLAIKQKYAISDELWHACLADIERVKKGYADGMMHPHHEVKNSPAIPSDIQDIMQKLLMQNNINPQSIILTLADQTLIKDTNNGTLAQTQFSLDISSGNKKPVIRHEYIPAQITFFPCAASSNLFEKKLACCAHEIQHVVLQHSVTVIILMQYLFDHCFVDRIEFEKSSVYHTLCEIHELQAEIFAAVQDPLVARSLKAIRMQDYYPDHLYEEHFCHLSTINLLWNIDAKLRKIR
jgi:hypothetical protein